MKNSTIAACAVFFPMRIEEVRDILYPYGVDGKPTPLSSVWTYPTDSMIKLGKPIETYAQEPPKGGERSPLTIFTAFPRPTRPL